MVDIGEGSLIWSIELRFYGKKKLAEAPDIDDFDPAILEFIAYSRQILEN